jgi:transcription antitermination factor NusG
MVTMPNQMLNGNIADATDWYVLYTRHQHEKTVAQMLSNKGFEILLPLYSSVNRWKDRTKLVNLPLFPCYVFLRGALERRVDIMKTPGVNALVSSAGRPASVPAEEMAAIQRIVASGSEVEPHPFMKCGDRVKVKGGPLTGLQGILVRKKDLYRLVLSVEMLGKSASVEVDAFLVERLGNQSRGGREHRYTSDLTEARV